MTRSEVAFKLTIGLMEQLRWDDELIYDAEGVVQSYNKIYNGLPEAVLDDRDTVKLIRGDDAR